MDTLRLVGFAMMIIFMILVILTIKLIGYELHQKKMNKQLNLMDKRLSDIEEKTVLPDHNS